MSDEIKPKNERNYLHQYLVDEVIEDFSEGLLSRRRALQMLGSLTSAAMAIQLLDACASPSAKLGAPAGDAKPAAPKRVSPLAVTEADPSVTNETIEIQSGDAKISAHHSRPSGDAAKKRPILLVCHENRGLTPHIQDVTRRFAKAGYCAIAVDLLSREGGTAKHQTDQIPGIIGKIPPERHVQDFQAALNSMKSKPYALASQAGMVGFCFGGGIAWRVAIGIPELKAAVAYYGPPPPDKDVEKIKASILAIYAGKDARINAGIPAIEAAMQKAKKSFEKVVYPDVEHAFNNDTGERYNESASLQAWEKTLSFLNSKLKA